MLCLPINYNYTEIKDDGETIDFRIKKVNDEFTAMVSYCIDKIFLFKNVSLFLYNKSNEIVKCI